MFRQTVRTFKRSAKTWNSTRIFGPDTHTEVVTRRTYWLIFIPIFSYDTITATNICMTN